MLSIDIKVSLLQVLAVKSVACLQGLLCCERPEDSGFAGVLSEFLNGGKFFVPLQGRLQSAQETIRRQFRSPVQNAAICDVEVDPVPDEIHVQCRLQGWTWTMLLMPFVTFRES